MRQFLSSVLCHYVITRGPPHTSDPRSAPVSRHAPPPSTQSRDAIPETIFENSVFDSFLLGNDRS